MPNSDLKPEKVASVRETVLEDAKKCVLKDRNATYGGPEDNFKDIAALANILLSKKLKEPLTSVDVAVFSLCIKLARTKSSPTHYDNWVDIAGYAACGAEVVTNSILEEQNKK